MVLDDILRRLAAAKATGERAIEFARLGYMEWLATTPGRERFDRAAMRAYARSWRHGRGGPTLSAFRSLLVAGMRRPGRPLDLALPKPRRRGGGRARRLLH